MTVTQADANSPRSITLNETEVLKVMRIYCLGMSMVKTNYITGIQKAVPALGHWIRNARKTNLHLYELTDQGRIDKGAIATTITSDHPSRG